MTFKQHWSSKILEEKKKKKKRKSKKKSSKYYGWSYIGYGYPGIYDSVAAAGGADSGGGE